jgi:ribonuclease BN (tRNA processing enzyme)
MENLGILAETHRDGLALLREESKKGLVFCFPGVGSAFSKKNDQTSLIIAKNGKTILIDVGTTIPRALSTRGISILDFDYYHITHSHADHMGGLEELLLMSRYVAKKKPRLIITEDYEHLLWEKSLKGGCEHNEADPLKFTDLINPIQPQPIRSDRREMYEIWVDDIHLLLFRTLHIPGEMVDWKSTFWSTGLLVDGEVLFTSDTRFDLAIFEDLPMGKVKTIFHDCQLFDPGVVHATYSELKTLPAEIRHKMWLIHYGDTADQFQPKNDGFAGFTEPWQMFRWKLNKKSTTQKIQIPKPHYFSSHLMVA